MASNPTNLTRTSSVARTTTQGLQRASSLVIPQRKVAETKPSIVPAPLTGALLRHQTRPVSSVPASLTSKNLEETQRQKTSGSLPVNKDKPKEDRLRQWAAGVANAVDVAKQKENVAVAPTQTTSRRQLGSTKTSVLLSKRTSQYSVKSGLPASDVPAPTLCRQRPSLYGLQPSSKMTSVEALPLSSQTHASAKEEVKPTSGIRSRPSLYSMRSGIASASALPETTRPSSNIRPNGITSKKPIELKTSALTAAKSLSRAASLLRGTTRSKLP
ncbi:uncharacterized protein EI90DRAFT_3035197 [Cantharellus anzutake]|uniref:uncharacterized protein n=1 Tax=Cantharellus anzutake TaxID=1750568 RepID=UPI0019033A41|nr:uncharacterized protein EI90DRAFT_3035197 [Cantharellus anzutake]KAF8340326.1 hypothetical protein EI90DRAFT_3035197 [Cantharellus anzutake]